MKRILITISIISIPVILFLIWVAIKTSSRVSNLEEQLEIERKLRNRK